MKTKYIRDASQVRLIVETSDIYEKDYQIHMLRKNHIAGLIPISHIIQNRHSRFSYEISGLKSMKSLFEQNSIKELDMLDFIRELIKTTQQIRRYLLDPGALLLHPSHVFHDGKTWNFVYLPNNKRPLQKGFHEITEFFVKHIDYADVPTITLACSLHKESLEENFNLQIAYHRYISLKESQSTLKPEYSSKNTCKNTNTSFMKSEDPEVSSYHNKTITSDAGSFNDVRMIQTEEDYKSLPPKEFKFTNPYLNKVREAKPEEHKKPFRMIGERFHKKSKLSMNNLILDEA